MGIITSRNLKASNVKMPNASAEMVGNVRFKFAYEHDWRFKSIFSIAGSHLERRLISIKGKSHVFHPPSHVTNEQLKLQTTKPPEQKLQLDWMYLSCIKMFLFIEMDLSS